MMRRLVVARYHEELKWILNLPTEISITIYNKGLPIVDESIINRSEKIEVLRNCGREAETYLHHMLHGEFPKGGSTIFSQGEPFSHSPDFLELLSSRDSWGSVQPLTDRWLSSHEIPPPTVLARDRGEDMGPLRVRTEIFSLYHFGALHYYDEGGLHIGENYRTGHGLEKGANLISHFLESAGWEELAKDARASDFGQFNFGAMFGIRNELIGRMPNGVLQKFHQMSRSHDIYAYVFERMWLHIFGLPFQPALQRIRPPSLTSP